MRPCWYLLAVGLAPIGAAFVVASQELVVRSRESFIEAGFYVLLQVTGWVIVIQWLRINGYLTVTTDT